jgi:class 3 adenylate cyclase
MDDLRSVLDAVGSQRAAIFGAFEGGPLCSLLAATFPDRVSALVLYATYARGAWATDYPWAWTDEELEADLKMIGEAIEAGGFNKPNAFFDRWIGETAPSLVNDPAMQPWLRKIMLSPSSPGASIALLRMEHDVDIRAILPTIRVPTLVINRIGDRIADLDEGRWLASQIPGATFVELPGVDHPPWAGDQDSVLDAIGAFLGLRRQPAEVDRVLSTVLFTDIVGSTERLTQLGDARWRSVLATHDDRCREEIERYRGRYVDSTGDGLLATFDGPARAVRCAQAIGTSVAELGIQIRAGVHTGEVELADDAVRGIAVHIGARVASLAGPSEILVSQTVKDLVAGSGLTFADAGEHELKGVPDKWHLYRVVE